MNHFLNGRPANSNPWPSLILTVNANTLPTPKPRKSPGKRKTLPQKKGNGKNKLGFFDENASTGKNELIGEDNMANDVNTIETGLGEKNVDESVTVNECDDEQSFWKDIGTTTEPNEALPIPMLLVRYNRSWYVYIYKNRKTRNV